MGKEKVHGPLLQYTDDTLLSANMMKICLFKLKNTLGLFKWCSKQRINWEKSALSGVNLSEELNYMARKLGCQTEEFPFIYLGLPLGGYPKGNLLAIGD